jgi:hypothetical protein
MLRHLVGGERWRTGRHADLLRARAPIGACAAVPAGGDRRSRYQLFATNTGGGQPAFLDARHSSHARVEDRIRCGKATGLDHLPSTALAVNQAWCAAATIAPDLLCWLRGCCASTGAGRGRTPRAVNIVISSLLLLHPIRTNDHILAKALARAAHEQQVVTQRVLSRFNSRSLGCWPDRVTGGSSSPCPSTELLSTTTEYQRKIS